MSFYAGASNMAQLAQQRVRYVEQSCVARVEVEGVSNTSG